MTHLTPHPEIPADLTPLTHSISDALIDTLSSWTHPAYDSRDEQEADRA